MAINFITGLPRQGKTLFTICYVKEKAEKEKRDVYYCNIPEVTIDGWTEIDHPDKWMELPDNCLVLVDELQDFWGNAAIAAKVPEPILELSKHGKRGIEFYFITQDPSLVHITPRKLCEWHYHVIRSFGTQNCTVHKFYRMQNEPDKVKRNAEKIIWHYKTEVFGKKDKDGNWIRKPWYKSADVHNVKRQIPWKVIALPIFVVLAVLMLYASYVLAMKTFSNAKSSVSANSDSAVAALPSSPGAASAPGPIPGPGFSPGQAGQLTAADYIKSYKPRINGFAHSAPRYDAVTQPVQAPYPAACLVMSGRCDCYTQQGTLLASTPDDICRQIVEHGFFVDWQQQETPAPAPRPITGYAEPPAMAIAQR